MMSKYLSPIQQPRVIKEYLFDQQMTSRNIIILPIIINFMCYLKLLLLALLVYLSTAKLYQVVSMFRHGARYHLNSYYDGNSTRQMWGELTAVGMRQHENLGRLLRTDYIDNLQFLNSDAKQSQIQIYTTDTNRTYASAISQLYGLYPLGTGQKLTNASASYHLPPYTNTTDCSQRLYALPKGLSIFPITINDDIVMTDCKNWDQELNKNEQRQLPTYKEMNLTYYPFMKRMADVFNIPTNRMNFSIISSLYDTLTVDKYLGRPMPEFGFSDSDYLNLRHLHYWYNFFKINFDLSRAINTGKLKKILKEFDDRISNLQTKTLKWTFLSAHDTDATGMLLGLNMSSSQCIEQLYRYGQTSSLNCSPGQQYATNLIWQLHSDDNKKFYVKIRHDGQYMYLCEKKEFACEYQEWKSRVNSIFVDIDRVCMNPEKKQILTMSRFESAWSE